MRVFGFPFILTVTSFFGLLWPDCISVSILVLRSLIGSSCVHLCHDSRVGHVSQSGHQDVTYLVAWLFLAFFPSGGFTGECLHSSVVLSTGVCGCLSPVLFLLRQRQISVYCCSSLRKPLVLLLAFASDSFESKVFLLVFDNP